MSRGFVALMSVIIISIVLVLLTVSLSFSSFYGRFNLLDTEFKIQSNNLATSCADMALLKLRLNSSYNLVFPGETVIVVGDSCTIKSVLNQGNNRVIITTANYHNVITNLKTTFDLIGNQKTSEEELPTV
jgi:hypothetical protein